MRIKTLIAAGAGALMLAPAAALASNVHHNGATDVFGSTGTTAWHAVLCRNDRDMRAPGDNGTQFSRCVPALARLDSRPDPRLV